MATNSGTIPTVIFTLGLSLAAGCATSGAAEKYEAEQKLVSGHIEIFDDLDFNVFTGQKWAEFHRSHSQDITV
jgi:hypothetical protein